MQAQERLPRLEPPETAEAAADAALVEVVCTVTATGAAEDGNNYIGLRFTVADPPPATTSTTYERWYLAVESKRNEMLATALTAISTRLPVPESPPSLRAVVEVINPNGSSSYQPSLALGCAALPSTGVVIQPQLTHEEPNLSIPGLHGSSTRS